MSVITQGELLYWAERSQNQKRALEMLGELVMLVPVLGLPDAAAQEYGRIRAGLEARGMVIGSSNLWIGAHAKAAGLTLVTNNEREFKRIAGLKIENWV